MLNENIFKKRLKELRKEYNITQQELSNKLGIVRTAIANYETGRTNPDLETLSLLAEIFDTSTDYLLGRTNLKNPSLTNIDKQIPSLSAEEAIPYNIKEKYLEYIDLNDIKDLSTDSKEDLKRYIELLKLKDMKERNKKITPTDNLNG